MIEVHHLEHSRSQRIIWLLEELGLPYKVTRYARDAKTYLAPPELLKIHPLGKSPVITDGDITVAESGAIVEYLIDKAGGKMRPAHGTQAHRDYTYWMHFAEGTAMPPLVMTLVFNKIENAPVPAFLKPIVLPIARGISKQVKSGFINPKGEADTHHSDQLEMYAAFKCKSDAVSAQDIDKSSQGSQPLRY